MWNVLFGTIRKQFRAIPNLETERLYLRKILPRDAEDMYEYSRDPDTSRFLLWEPHSSLSFTKSHISYLQREYQRARFFDWALVEKASDKMIGTCGFTEIYEKTKTAEVGYVLSPKFHRRGLAPEALKRVMDFGFTVLGLEALFARFMEENLASQKVLIRAGFREIPTEAETFYKRGKKQQILTYTISREEYFLGKK